MLETMVTEISRQSLYDKIWQISVAGVANEFGIPYAQLMKQVKAANIPIPPSGYWTKLSFGKPVEKEPLTEPADTVVSLYKTIKTTLPLQVESVPITPQANRHFKESIVQKPETAIIATGDTDIQKEQEKPSEPIETYEQYGQTYNVYNRERLYQEVWEKPVTEVAKHYRVSDVAIHKVCKSLNIPTPGLGYWAKVRAGKPVNQIPLPKNNKLEEKSGIRTNLEPQPQIAEELLRFLSPEDKSMVLSVAMQVQMPDENARMHAKITAYRKKIVEWHKEVQKHDQYWNRRNKDNVPFLADTISEITLPRVCRIIDALIKAVEPLGCSLTDGLSFLVNGETVSLSISESKDQIDHVPTREENIQLLKYEEDKRKHSWASKPNIRKYDHVYNGHISITIGGEKSYRDCKSYIVEDRLGDMIILLYEVSNILQKQREERDIAERKRKEEELKEKARREQYNLEIERINSLLNESENYDIACKIRAYVTAVEQKDSLSEEENVWISWAKQKADWYDPVTKRKDEFLGVRNHSKDDSNKRLEKSYSSWRW